MTNAQLHVDAFIAAFGVPPVWLPNLKCWVLEVGTDGNVLVTKSNVDGTEYPWRYPNPPVMVEDPAGQESDGSTDDDGNLIPMRTDPLPIQISEYTKQVLRWRAEAV